MPLSISQVLENTILKMIINAGFKVFHIKTTAQKDKIQRVIDYIDTCIGHMENIMGYKKDVNEASVEQSRKFLQTAYHEMALQLNDVAKPVESEIIKNSIVSARIYYHAVKEGKVVDKDLEIDYESRYQIYTKNIYNQKCFRQNSYEAFMKQLVKDKREIDKEHLKIEIQRIMEVCQEDVARIMSLKEQLKTRKAS